MTPHFARLALASLLLAFVFPVPSLRANPEGDDLRAADAELNKAFQKALGAVPSAAAKTSLRNAQRAWITYRDAEARLYADLGTGGTGLSIIQTELTQERTKRLKGIAEDAKEHTVQ